MSPDRVRSRCELASFRAWAVTDGWRAQSTADHWVNVLRAFFRDQETANELISNPKRLHEAAISYGSTLADSSQVGFRAAFHAFMKFARLPVEVDPFPDRRNIFDRARHRDPVLVAVAPLLRVLEKYKIPWKAIPPIRWRDVHGGVVGGVGRIDDHHNRTYHEAPLDKLMELNLWAGNGERALPDQPLVPFEPKSMSPMPIKRLMRVARL